ncbi:MAG: tetratricopeptide repeat protein [PVC group bacterium]
MLTTERYFYPPGSVLPRIGCFFACLILLAAAASGCGDRAARTYQRGLRLARQRKYDQAVVEMRRLIQMDPENAKAHNALGQIYRAQNLYTKAIEELTLSVEMNNSDPELPYNLGCLYRDLEDLSRTESCYRQAVEIDPRFAPALYRLGAVCADLGKDVEAEKHFQAFLAVDPDRPAPGHNNLGVLLWKKGNRAEARAEFEKALESEPELPEALYNFGVSSLLLSEKDRRGTEALLAYLGNRPHTREEPALKRLLEQAGAVSASESGLLSRDDYLKRGRGYEAAGQFHLAEKEYRRALELDPSAGDVHYRLGMLYDTFLGDTVGAVHHYETFLAANLGSSRAPEVIARLKNVRSRMGGHLLAGEGLLSTPPAVSGPSPAWTAPPPALGADDYYREGERLEKEGETARAISAFQRCLELRPEHPKAHLGLGIASLAQGDYEKAVSALQKARSLDGSLPVREHLARAYLLLGAGALSSKRLDESIAYYQKAREEGSREDADEGLWKAHHACFRSHARDGDFSSAAAHLKACLELKPEVADDYLALGDLYAQNLNDRKRARTYYALYLDRAPEGKDADRIKEFIGPSPAQKPPAAAPARPPTVSAADHYNRGANYQRAGQFEAARQEYLRAINARPDFYQAFYNLGTLYNQAGRPDEALSTYKQAARLKPDFALAQLAIFNLYYHNYKMKNLARPFAERYVQLAPGTPQAKELLQWLRQ